jgi:addiction module HigA family antidote
MGNKKVYPATQPMYNPPHPGAVLKDAIFEGLDLTVTEAATYLDVDRITLSRVLNEQAGISVEMALRLSKAFGTTPNVWINMQRSYDLWQAQRNPKIDLSRVRRFEGVKAYAPM